MHRNRAKLCVWDEWNKLSYIAITVLNNMIFNLSNHRAPEYTSVREATG
jgi:hypothetical protein